MRFKKVICTALSAAQVLAMLGAGSIAFAEDTGRSLSAKMTDSMPVIDGDLSDSIWNMDTRMEQTAEGTPAHRANFGVTWDYSYLYLAVDIQNDGELIPGKSWQNGDIVSLFLDSTMHKSAPYQDGDWQIGFGFNPDDSYQPAILFGGGVTASEEQRELVKRNILSCAKQTETGWALEAAVSWDALGIDPFLTEEIGFNVSADNKLGSHAVNTLDALIWCKDGAESFWNDTTGFGVLKLSDETVHNTDSRVIYEENFDSYENGTLPADVSANGDGWSVQDGRLVGDFSNTASIEQRLALPALGRNFAYSADITFEDAVNTGRWTSITYRAPSDNGLGYYHFTNRLNGAGEISMKSTDNQWPTAFVNTNGTAEAKMLEKGKSYHLNAAAFAQNFHHVRTGTAAEEGFDHAVTAYDRLGTSRPATMLSDLQQAGRFGVQVDRAKVAFDNIRIEKLEATSLTVTGVPDSAASLDNLPDFSITADFSDGSTGHPIDIRDAKLYSSDSGVLHITQDGEVRALRPGTATFTVIVENKLWQKEITVTDSGREPAITSISLQNREQYQSVLAGTGIPISEIHFSAVNEAFEALVIQGDKEGMIFTSSDESVVSVKDGRITAVGKGTATVTAAIGGALDSVEVWVRADENDNLYLDEDFEDGMPENWSKIGTSGSYEIVSDGSGNHALQLSPYTRVLIPMPEGAGDYIIEGDITFISWANTARWASIMYRIQNDNFPYYQFAIRQDTTAQNGAEFAVRTPNDGWDVRDKASFDGRMDAGVTRRIKIVVTGDRVKQYLDGKELIFTNAAYDYTSGDIGLQADNATVRYDNLKVTLNPEPLPEVPVPENNYASAKTLNENLVASPTVVCQGVQSLDDLTARITDSVTTSVMNEVKLEDGILNVYSGETRLASLDDYMDALYSKIILIFRVEDTAAADALAAYINSGGIEDLQVVSSDADVLKSFRDQAAAVRGSLLMEQDSLTKEEAYGAVRAANTAKAKTIMIKSSAADKEIVEAMQRRLMSVWVVSDDTTVGNHAAVTSGANGIVTSDPQKLAEDAEIYDERTITRRSFIVGHRGTPGNAPENTMISMRKAVGEYGAQMFENDVYLTKDGEVIVLHDNTFARTTDILTNTRLDDSIFTNGVTRANCRPKDLTLAQIKLLDAGSYYGEQFAGEQVPTLREQLAYMADENQDVVMFLELKDASEGIEKACADLIKEYGMEDRVAFITFNQKSIPLIQAQLPGNSVGNLTGQGAVNTQNPKVTIRKILNDILPKNTTYNGSYGESNNAEFLKEAYARGLTFWPWTYRDTANFAWAIDNGLNGLTTDYANWAKDYVFGITGQQEEYLIAPKVSMELTAIGYTNKGEQKTFTPEIVVIDGAENISVKGNTVTGVQNGEAAILLRAKVAMGEARYEEYSQPLTITVGTAALSSDTLIVDNEQSIVSGIAYGSTAEDVLSQLSCESGMTLRVTDSDGIILDGSAAVSTGMQFQLVRNSSVLRNYSAAVSGDLGLGGRPGVSALLAVKSHILGRDPLTPVQTASADLNRDGRINIFDLVELKLMILKGQL